MDQERQREQHRSQSLMHDFAAPGHTHSVSFSAKPYNPQAFHDRKYSATGSISTGRSFSQQPYLPPSSNPRPRTTADRSRSYAPEYGRGGNLRGQPLYQYQSQYYSGND
eukprot:UN28344